MRAVLPETQTMGSFRPNKGVTGTWVRLGTWSVLSASSLVLLDWLFFVTKPSFLSSIVWQDRLVALSGAALHLSLAGLAIVGVCAFLAEILPIPLARSSLLFIAAGVPALLTGASLVLMLDNFTNTVLSVGIRDAVGFEKLPYALFCIVMGMACWKFFWRDARRAITATFPVALSTLAATVLGLSSLGTATDLVGARPRTRELMTFHEPVSRTARPNILLVGSDGINAAHSSLYGYHRRTTPFLEHLAPESLVFTNAFTNSAHTGASLVAMLTGKLPTETGLIYPPDVLKGRDAYESLPALLRALGYRTFQSSIRYYADPIDLNMRDAFDLANGRRSSTRPALGGKGDWLGQKATLLLGATRTRLEDRLAHVFGVREIARPYAEVTGEDPSSQSDEHRIDSLVAFIDEDSGPFFAHVHLMGTHGAKFFPRERVFSAGEVQAEDWMTDFYDDAVLSFDTVLKELARELRIRQLLDRTILVIYSDHGMKYKVDRRLPLVIRFPEGRLAGEVTENVQSIDVAPTLVDALELRKPPWMGGRSLLEPQHDPCRPIFSAGVNMKVLRNRGGTWESLPGPPFFSLGRVGLTICDQHFKLDVTSGQLLTSVVPDHRGPCGRCATSESAARAQILEHLRSAGYEVSMVAKGEGMDEV